MRRNLLITGIFTLIGFSGFGHLGIKDTILIEEVTTYAITKKYQAGAKIERISSEQLQLSQEGGLENVLLRFTSIYVKSNAGGLSTIRLRGTSPDHTSVNFGGINLNSLTLGHSNASNIPSYLFDGLSLQYGSASAVNGSGSIGGAIHLGLQNNWTDGLKVKTQITAGSFGEQLYGAKVFLGNGKFESVTRLYYYNKKNDFPFDNPYTSDVENPGAIKDNQHGASIENMGLIQEFNYKFKDRQTLKTAFWVEDDWHQIQLNMPTNYNYKGNSEAIEELKNDNIRFWSEYKNESTKLNHRLGLGFVHDKQVFNETDQIIQTDRLIVEGEVKQDFNQNSGYKTGVKYKHMVPEVHSYSDSVIENEQHVDLYLSYFHYLFQKLKLTVNFRQQFVTNYDAPFTPSLGAEYSAFSNSESSLKLTSTISKSYRIPTFNDRFWGNQGNPNLKAEEGINLEAGANYLVNNGNVRSSIKLNAFYMEVENWIEWRFRGVWQAQNVMEVVSKGIEFQSKTDFPIGELNCTAYLNYTRNIVEPVKTEDATGVLNRQIRYVPKDVANASLFAKYKQWQLFVDGAFTGMRFADDIGNELDAYFLMNSGLVYKLKKKDQLFKFTLSVNNILDKNYQNEKFYAMPGRSIRFSIATDLNIIN